MNFHSKYTFSFSLFIECEMTKIVDKYFSSELNLCTLDDDPLQFLAMAVALHDFITQGPLKGQFMIHKHWWLVDMCKIITCNVGDLKTAMQYEIEIVTLTAIGFTTVNQPPSLHHPSRRYYPW